MSGLLVLALARLAHDRVRAGLLVLCLAVPLAIPLTTARLARAYERGLDARAAATPLVLGAAGSRFDLVLGALWFRSGDLAPIEWADVARVSPDEGLAIPIHARFTARGRPIVGTTPEYFELRGLAVERGGPALVLGECVLGADVARDLDLAPGDRLSSDPRELYDLSEPPALVLRVAGVLARAGAPDDGAVFVDVKTAWALEGLVHGHAAAAPDALVLARDGDAVTYGEALLELQEVTDANRASFHAHGAAERMPLSAVIVVPRDAKAGTILSARVNASGPRQVVAPAEVVDELYEMVLRVRTLVDGVAAVLLASTALLFALVLWLSARLRADELRTLERIGASKGAVRGLLALEVALVLGASAAVALAISAALGAALPRWIGWIA